MGLLLDDADRVLIACGDRLAIGRGVAVARSSGDEIGGKPLGQRRHQAESLHGLRSKTKSWPANQSVSGF